MYDSTFALAQSYRGKRRKYGLLLYNTETLWSMHLNELGLEVVRRLDGQHTLQQIESEINVLDSFRGKNIGDDIFQLIAFLFTNQIITPEPVNRTDDPLYLEEEEYPLDLVTIQLVEQCNLHCRHCFIEAEAMKRGVLEFAQFKAIIKRLKAKHPLEIVLTGGEPLLHRNFLEIGCFLKENEIPFSIFTNGVLMTAEIAQEIGRLKPVCVQVSLDGMTAEVNDTIRGKGTYGKAVSAIKMLVEQGVRVVVSTVFCQVNWEQYREFPDFVRNLGAKSFNPMNVMLSGRASSFQDELGLSTDQIVEMQRYFIEYQQSHSDFTFGEISLKDQAERSARGLEELCNAGKNSCFIDYEGNIFPCQTFPKQFKTGNIFTEDFDAIWSGTIFQQVRGWTLKEIPECGACAVKEFCAGGCLGYNLTVNGGTLGTPEIQSCEWKKKLYVNTV